MFDLSENLKKLRESVKMSQTDLATELGVSLAYYNKMEKKVMRPSVEFLVHLSAFYGITIDDIVHLKKPVFQRIKLKKGKKRKG